MMPLTHSPARFVAIALLVLSAMGAAAQSPPPLTDPRQMDEHQRKAYSASLHEARELLDRKQYAEAIATLDKLSTERPREPQARFLKGIALTDQGNVDAA